MNLLTQRWITGILRNVNRPLNGDGGAVKEGRMVRWRIRRA